MSTRRTDLRLRHSVAPRVFNGSLEQRALTRNDRHSVRAAPADSDANADGGAILTTFVWKEAAASVLLAGSFDDWRKHEMIHVQDAGRFILVVEIPPGDYFYRFVVDGRWCVSEDDPSIKEDPFGELSHFISISHDSINQAPNATAVATPIHADINNDNGGEEVIDEGASDTDPSSTNSIPLPPRQRDAALVQDYDDDINGEFDLQADVFEAMKDISEKTTNLPPGSTSPPHMRRRNTDVTSPGRRRKKPGRRMMARVFALLFAQPIEEDPEDDDEEGHTRPMPPTRNQRKHAIAANRMSTNGRAGIERGLRIWFPAEKNMPDAAPGKKLEAIDKETIIDPSDVAMKLHQVEDNAENRQQLGKMLFSQGKYDAALALFSLAVKLREDNGLRNAKTNAVAHTDVASAFIHLQDLKNAEKHLRISLNIFSKSTFSGGKAELGDVHCFLGVVNDMKKHLKAAEVSYRNAIDLYEKCKATSNNPNYETAVDNLNSNIKRQKYIEEHGPPPEPKEEETETPGTDVETASVGTTPAPAGNNNAGAPPPPPRRKPPQPPSGAPRRKLAQPPPPQSRPKPPAPPAAPPAPSQVDNDRIPSNASAHVPTTWKAMAAHARKSMPAAPEEDGGPTGTYEEMARGWHMDGRRHLAAGRYEEAKEMYTLAIYSRKRHGPWVTTANALTLVEHARAEFATRDLQAAAGTLKDAIGVLEQLDNDPILLGETYSSLGSVLDRSGKNSAEAAEQAHIAAMVTYGRMGMSTDDKRWNKAWRNLCGNLAARPDAHTPEQVWDIIDAQITGVKPVATISSVVV